MQTILKFYDPYEKKNIKNKKIIKGTKLSSGLKLSCEDITTFI